MFYNLAIFLILFSIFSMIGYTSIKIFLKIFHIKFSICLELLPLLPLIGMVITEILFFIICLIGVNSIVTYIYVFIFLGGFFIITYKEKFVHKVRGYFSEMKQNLRKYITFIIIFVFAWIFFSYIAFRINVSPPSDSLDHNMTIALIIQNGRFPNSYAPIYDDLFNIFQYPEGSHVLGVFTSLLLFSYPAISTLQLMSVVASLIPLLIFGIVYLKTKSAVVSILSFFIAFLIPAGRLIPPYDSNDLILGLYWMGAYAQLLANMELIGLFCTLLIFTEVKGQIKDSAFFLAMGILGVGIVLAHYSLGFFVLAFIGLEIILVCIKKIQNFLSKKPLKRKIIFLLLLGIVIGFSSYGLIFLYGIASTYVSNEAVKHLCWDSKGFAYFFSNEFGLLISLSFLIFIISSIKRKQIPIYSHFYMICLSLVIIVNIDPGIARLIFILPGRSVIPLIGMSIMEIVIDLDFLLKLIKSKQKFTRFLKILHKKVFYKLDIGKVLILSLFLGIYLQGPPVYTNYLNNWYLVGENYSTVIWISENIDDSSLILNDPGFDGLYITSFKYKNVVFDKQAMRRMIYAGITDSFYVNKTKDGFLIFNNVTDSVLIKNIIEKYNITYIFSSSTPYYYDYYEEVYKDKQYSPADLISSFNSYPFLTIVFQQGLAVVYKTHLS